MVDDEVPARGEVPSEAVLRHRFVVAYRQHYRAILAYALRRADSVEDAHEVLADTFTVAWRRWADAPSDNALPWLYGIARRVLSDQRRSARRLRQLRQKLSGVRSLPTAAGPEAYAVASQDKAAVTAALASLSEDDREILRLAAWEDLPHADIAVALDCSVSAVGVRLHRARARLRKALEDSDDWDAASGGGRRG